MYRMARFLEWSVSTSDRCFVSGCQPPIDRVFSSVIYRFGVAGVFCDLHADELDRLTHEIAFLSESIKSFSLIIECHWDDEREPYRSRVRQFGIRLCRVLDRVDELLGARTGETPVKGDLVQDGSHI